MSHLNTNRIVKSLRKTSPDYKVKKKYTVCISCTPRLLPDAVKRALEQAMSPLPVELVINQRALPLHEGGNYLHIDLPWQAYTSSWYGRMAEAVELLMVKSYHRTAEPARQHMRMVVKISDKDLPMSIHCGLNTGMNAENFAKSVNQLLRIPLTSEPLEEDHFYVYGRRQEKWVRTTADEWNGVTTVAVKHTRQDYEAAVAHTKNNKQALAMSDYCACLCCQRIYEADKIKEWTADELNGDTAHCIYCSATDIIGSATHLPLKNKQYLHDLNAYHEDAKVVMVGG